MVNTTMQKLFPSNAQRLSNSISARKTESDPHIRAFLMIVDSILKEQFDFALDEKFDSTVISQLNMKLQTAAS